MRLSVRYCSTAAGRVAYSTAGSGPVLLLDSGWVTDLRQQLETWAFGRFVERLAEHFTVVRFDKPGCGLSDRDGVDLSFETQVATALAVVDAVGARRFRVFGASQGAHVAASLAARWPDRVDRLVLYGACADGHDLAPVEVRDSVVALVRAHWGLGLQAMANTLVSDPTAEDWAVFAAFQRASASAEVAARLLQVYYDTDMREVLPTIHARTTVLHREGDRGTRFALGRQVATLVPDAQFVPLAGRSHVFYHGDWESVLDAVVDFLADEEDEVVLTGRELQVAALVADGLTNQAIATRLRVAPRTAESHVENIRRKLQVRSRAQIAAWATERRLRL